MRHSFFAECPRRAASGSLARSSAWGATRASTDSLHAAIAAVASRLPFGLRSTSAVSSACPEATPAASRLPVPCSPHRSIMPASAYVKRVGRVSGFSSAGPRTLRCDRFRCLGVRVGRSPPLLAAAVKHAVFGAYSDSAYFSILNQRIRSPPFSENPGWPRPARPRALTP